MSFFPEPEAIASMPRLRSATPLWVGPPAHELAEPVAVTTVLARRLGVALCLRRIDVYRDGWRFAISVRACRPETMSDDDWADVMEKVQWHRPFRRRGQEGALRMGIQFPDGSTVIGNDSGRPGTLEGGKPDGPRLTLRPGGGGGSDEEYDLGIDAWLWPAPLEGPLRLVYDWVALGIPEGSLTIDSTPLIAARDNVQEVWLD
jgi:hypothetical protein